MSWSESARTARTGTIEKARDKTIKQVAETYGVGDAELRALNMARSEDSTRITGVLDGKDISFTRTAKGVEGKRGDQVLSQHEAEIEYLNLSKAL